MFPYLAQNTYRLFCCSCIIDIDEPYIKQKESEIKQKVKDIVKEYSDKYEDYVFSLDGTYRYSGNQNCNHCVRWVEIYCTSGNWPKKSKVSSKEEEEGDA